MKNRALLVFLSLVLVVSLAAFGACAPEEEFTLKITAIGEGTTSPAPGTYTHTEGKSITVTAIPNTGYELGYWEGDVSGTADSVTFKMTSDKSVVAVFVEEVAAWEWPEVFKIATHGIGASDYAQMTAIAPIIEQVTGMKVRVVPEDSSATKSKWIVEGFFDAKTESANEIGPFNIEATYGYATRDGGPFQVRGFAQTLIQSFGIMVRGDSEIRTIYDIGPGTKMSVWTMPGGLELVKGVLAWANLTVDDVILVETADYPDNMRMIADGRADVCCLALPSSSVVEELEAGPHGLHWLDLNSAEDPEGAARYNEIMPATMFAPITIGVPSSIGHWGWGGPSLLFTTADADPELIYQLVKCLDENFDLYKDLHPNNADMSLDRFRVSLDLMYVPIHEGAIRYLKEKDMWDEDDDIRQAYNVDLVTRYCDAYAEAIDMADEMGITVDPENEEWIDLWEDYKTDIELPRFKVVYEF